MNVIRKIMMGLGGVVVVALVLALASPKTVHAVVSALVTVSNTTANPAITADADISTRIPYLSSVDSSVPLTGPATFEADLATVPSGYRLVVQNVNFQMSAESGNPVPYAYVCSAQAPNDCKAAFTGTYTGSAGVTAIGNQNVIRYIAAGDNPVVWVFYDSAPGTEKVSLAGYLENCAVTGCPAIVH